MLLSRCIIRFVFTFQVYEFLHLLCIRLYFLLVEGIYEGEAFQAETPPRT